MKKNEKKRYALDVKQYVKIIITMIAIILLRFKTSQMVIMLILRLPMTVNMLMKFLNKIVILRLIVLITIKIQSIL